MSLQRRGKSPVYKWCRILVCEVGVKSADKVGTDMVIIQMLSEYVIP